MARTCYYELLEVERSATEADLKRAYRKKALIWHPDKNHGNIEEATRIFAEIKEAYETLNDPQERAWYDNHRDQILRGNDVVVDGEQGPSTNMSYMSTEALMKFFSVSSFRGFDDTPSGFYTVYRDLFARLRDEELDVYDPETEYQMDYLQNLDFGDSFTHFDEDEAHARGPGAKKGSKKGGSGSGATLKDFYNFWTTFTTRKSFGWFDRFKLADAENRQIRRLMEKENKVARDKARREFVETVQKLASWLKKRDPRFKQYTESNRKASEERERQRQKAMAEKRAIAAEEVNNYVRQTWEEVDYTQFLDEHEDLSDIAQMVSDDNSDGIDESSEEADVLDPENDLVCFTCDKIFKTAAQKSNHEKSKKHLKAVSDIRREMIREERRMAKEAKTRAQSQATAQDSADENASSDQDFVDAQESLESLSLSHPTEPTELMEPMEPRKKSKKQKNKRRQQLNPVLDLSDTDKEEDSEVSRPAGSEHLSDAKDSSGVSTADGDSLKEPDEPAQQRQRVSKKELRRERQKIKAEKAGDIELTCNVCNKQFDSRNHLFTHIKDTGHALANGLPRHVVEQIQQDRSKAKKGGKKKK
ncbi:hypothetical protein GGI07_004645 [Coemansia sp. Benny D115]|nr:hypothetical protein GGI07_004645 [Coemansia sp. Benny D115]